MAGSACCKAWRVLAYNGEVDTRTFWYQSQLLARLIIPEDRILFTSFHLVKAFEGISPIAARYIALAAYSGRGSAVAGVVHVNSAQWRRFCALRR